MRSAAQPPSSAPAFRILARACRAAATGNSDPLLSEGIAHPGGDAVVAMAMRHRVSSPVLRILAGDPRLERDAVTRLLGLARERQMTALRLSSVLVAVSQELSRSGIRHLVLKGSALSQRLYDDLAARDCKDIDIFVDPGAWSAAEAAITNLGFSRTHSEPHAANDSWRAALAPKDTSFRSSDRSIELELHDRLFDAPQLLPLSFDDLWYSRTTVEVAGTALPVLSSTEEFLYLCGHGALCAWFRLKWLQDVARILAFSTPESRARIVEAADAHGVRPMVTSAAMLVERIFELPVDGMLTTAGSTTAERIFNRSCEALAAPAAASNAPSISRLLRMLVMQLGLRRDWRYRRAVLDRALLSQNDIDMLRLPPFARGLYYPLRPFLLALRRIRVR